MLEFSGGGGIFTLAEWKNKKKQNLTAKQVVVFLREWDTELTTSTVKQSVLVEKDRRAFSRRQLIKGESQLLSARSIRMEMRKFAIQQS